jgi:hypothetical protein
VFRLHDIDKKNVLSVLMKNEKDRKELLETVMAVGPLSTAAMRSVTVVSSRPVQPVCCSANHQHLILSVVIAVCEK